MTYHRDRFGWTNDPDDERKDRLAEWPTDPFRDDDVPDEWWPFDTEPTKEPSE